MINGLERKFQQGTVKSNGNKTRFFAVWTVEMTEDELLRGCGEKAFTKAFDTEEDAESFLSELRNK